MLPREKERQVSCLATPEMCLHYLVVCGFADYSPQEWAASEDETKEKHTSYRVTRARDQIEYSSWPAEYWIPVRSG